MLKVNIVEFLTIEEALSDLNAFCSSDELVEFHLNDKSCEFGINI